MKATFLTSDMQMTVLMAVQRLEYDQPTSDQSQAIEAFVDGKDVLVCLPTGSGKSLCFPVFPLISFMINSQKGNIVLWW